MAGVRCAKCNGGIFRSVINVGRWEIKTEFGFRIALTDSECQIYYHNRIILGGGNKTIELSLCIILAEEKVQSWFYTCGNNSSISKLYVHTWMRDIYTPLSWIQSFSALWKIAEWWGENLHLIAVMGNRARFCQDLVYENNHKGYISSFPNIVSYSVQNGVWGS